MIVVDANFLILLLDPEGAMGQIERGKDRILHFIEALVRDRAEIIVPAPVIAELVAGRVERIEEIVTILTRTRGFSVQPFDTVTAIQTGELIREVQDTIPPDQRLPGWKVAMKYDAMIAATARVRRAKAVCTADVGMARYLRGSGIDVILIGDLPLPPEDPQGKLSV